MPIDCTDLGSFAGRITQALIVFIKSISLQTLLLLLVYASSCDVLRLSSYIRIGGEKFSTSFLLRNFVGRVWAL
jgi:hypothetical protein